MTYKVIVPLVLAKDRDGRTHHVYQDGEISWLSAEQAAYFLEAGLVAKVDDGGRTPAAAGDEGDEPDVPKQAAPKAVWVEYAVNGAPEGERISDAEAEALTKAELVERFN